VIVYALSVVENLRIGSTYFSGVVSVAGVEEFNEGLRGVSSGCGWEEVAEWSATHLKGEGLKTRLCKLSLGAVVYHLWLHWNNLIHGNKLISEEPLIAKIKWEVRSRLMGKGKYRRTAENSRRMQIWNLQNLS
jgi:hypothetical protein